MTKYICPNCNKDFKQKINFINHTEKKKIPCETNINLSIDKSVDDKLINLLINPPQKLHKTPQKSTKIIKNDNYIVNEVLTTINEDKNIIKKHKCSYCEKSYSRTDSLSRHVEMFCKNKIHFDNLDDIKSKFNNINNININNVKYEKLVEDNIKLIKMLEEYEKIIKENNLLKQTIFTTSVNTINNGLNNGNINNGAINSGNTINIVQFGKEDISKCNLIEMMNIYLKSTGGNIFSNMLKYLNFNPNHPENFNILMSDLARENVKIHNGTKFVTRKFKNVKNDILNVLNSHITNMCDTYIENPNTKKNDDILTKLKINDISVKLINNDDITPLLINKEEKEIMYDSEGNEMEDSDDESDIDELDLEGQRKLSHYENKRQGLQEITEQKLKDELYNNRNLIQEHHSSIII
jgi:hypothetical protein